MLEDKKIVNYILSQDEKVCLLVGMSTNENTNKIGKMQCYSIENQTSQIIVGNLGTLGTINTSKHDSTQILCYERKRVNQSSKLIIQTLTTSNNYEHKNIHGLSKTIQFSVDLLDDIPVLISISNKFGIIYVLTNLGYLYLYDALTGQPIFRMRATKDLNFSSSKVSLDGDIIGITPTNTQMLSITLNEANLIPYLRDTLENEQLALQVSLYFNYLYFNVIFFIQFILFIVCSSTQFIWS